MLYFQMIMETTAKQHPFKTQTAERSKESLNVMWSNTRKHSRGSFFLTTASYFWFFKFRAQPHTTRIVPRASTIHTPKEPSKNLVHPLCQQCRNKKITNGKPTKNFNVIHFSQFYKSGTNFFYTHGTLSHYEYTAQTQSHIQLVTNNSWLLSAVWVLFYYWVKI